MKSHDAPDRLRYFMRLHWRIIGGGLLLKGLRLSWKGREWSIMFGALVLIIYCAVKAINAMDDL